MRKLMFVLAACGGSNHSVVDSGTSVDTALSDTGPSCADAAVPPSTDCTGCAEIAVASDPPVTTPGSFKGYADPSLAHDPGIANRVWLAYSYPHLDAGHNPQGQAVTLAAVSNHLARSDDGGATFSYVGVLYPDIPTTDPEGSGEAGVLSSETASLASITVGSTTTWYGAHLRYFLEPQTGYHPKYSTSWTVRIGAAASPEDLTNAPETTLGVTTTAAVYNATHMDTLAGLAIQDCAMLNNPTLFTSGGTLYLIVECLAFTGTTMSVERSTTHVFATEPSGAPTTWTWRHAGLLADHTLATELGDDTIQQPDVSLAADGTPIAIVTPAHVDSSVQVGTVGDGCVAVQLSSIDPPAIARDCAGRAIVRAHVTGASLGACTHDAKSATGIVSTSQGSSGFMIHSSLAHP